MSHKNALAVFGDLYATIDDDTAEALAAAITSQRKRRLGRVAELCDRWLIGTGSGAEVPEADT